MQSRVQRKVKGFLEGAGGKVLREVNCRREKPKGLPK